MQATTPQSGHHVLVIDLETGPDPRATTLMPPRERAGTMSPATHHVAVVSILVAEEAATGWRVRTVKSHAIDDTNTEQDLLRRIDALLLESQGNAGTLVTYNGRRHDLPTIKRRTAAHLLFELKGIAAIDRSRHLDLMTDSIAGGGQWFKLRDVAAGLGIPVAHEVAGRGVGAASRSTRKGEVDVAITFLLYLYDLAYQRSDPAPVLDGWRALGDYVARQGSVGQHLAQFRRHPFGLGPAD